MKNRTIALILSILCIFTFCGLPAYAQERTAEFETGPAPDWFRPLLAEADFMVRSLSGGGSPLNESLLVMHGGKLVYERYARGWDKDTPHVMFSITKSVVSALVGIAIQEGKIKGVDQKAWDFFKDDVVLAPGQESKKDITIKHLLTMSSGLPGDDDDQEVEWWNASASSGEALDSGVAAFSIPQVAASGERFAYSSGPGAQALACLVSRAVGMNLFEYAKKKLFEPLGMTSVRWDAAADGNNYGGFGIYMTSRDMMRFGLLYLNNGRWEGKQIIPADYVAATPPPSKLNQDYGYMFWDFADLTCIEIPHLKNAYYASGSFGQFICILPESDTVIVRTGSAGQLVRTLSKAILGNPTLNSLFMRLIYPSTSLKGVPLDYLMGAM